MLCEVREITIFVDKGLTINYIAINYHAILLFVHMPAFQIAFEENYLAQQIMNNPN